RPVPAQPRLAGRVRPRAGEGRGDAPARLRHGFGRQAPGLGLSLPVPRPRLHREGRQRLSAHPGGVEPRDLNVMVRSMSNVVRWRTAVRGAAMMLALADEVIE